MNTNIEYIHNFLESVKDDSSLFERILDDIYDSKRLNNGDDKHKVYYLQLSEDENSGEKDFWVTHIRYYFHIYVYAMLLNWKEQWADDEMLNNRLDSIQNSFPNEIASEINKFNEEDTENFPFIVLRELKFISDAFLWNCKKEVPFFTEEQKINIEKYRQNYRRYITLINDDKQEDIAKDIDKYLSYCMTIDDAYNSTDCLTSFIMRLSGTEDNSVNFDVLLKSIPADRWGIDKIRLSLIKGEMIIPANIIKLAIYSKSNFTQNDVISENDVEKRKAFVNDLFDRATEDIFILTNNQTRLEIVDQLKLSSYIRDYLVKDKNTIEICEQDTTLNNKRQEILDKVSEFQNKIIESTKSTISTIYDNKEIKDFSFAKKELVELLNSEIQFIRNYIESHPEEAKLCKGIQKHIETCETIISRCKNEKYVILLMGEYQSGKTTTLDAFCGGIPVGAIGDGNKTSAVPLAISYAEIEKENVIPIWKEIDDLNNTFLRIHSYLPEMDSKGINICDENMRNTIKGIIENMRNDKNREKIPKGDLQYIVLCSMILEFWDTSSLKQFKDKKFSINEVHQLSRFPHKMIERWERGGASSFSIEEVAFIFIKQIDCFCSSEVLKEMNCILLDCPGLFASDYDTQVTETAMNDANAVLFIFPRDKEGGEKIEKSLNKLKNQYPDFQQKLLFANNVQLSDKNTNSIFESNWNTVKRIFGESFELVRYDAMVSYIAQIKKSCDYRLLDPQIVESFINEHPKTSPLGIVTPYANFDEVWYDYCRPYDSPDEVLKISGFSVLKNTLVSFAEKNKAFSLIVSDGIEKLKAELNMLQHYLYLSYIEPYKKSKDELQKQWEERIRFTAEFEEEAAKKINSILFENTKGESSVEKKLSDAIYEKLFSEDVFNSLNEKICDSLYDNVKTLKKLKNNEDEFKKYTTGLVSECLNNMIAGRISYWNRLLSSNQDKDFQNIFFTAINSFEENMDTIWREKIFREDTYFKEMRGNYYVIGKDSSSFTTKGNEQKANVPVDHKNVSTAVTINYATMATGWTIAIGGYGVFFYTCLVSGPIGWILGGLAIIFGGGYIATKMDEYNKSNFRKKMIPGLKEELKKNDISKSLKEMITNEVNRLFKAYCKNLKVDDEKLQREKDFSLTIKDESNVEPNCFHAVSAFKKIETQINQYDEFYSKL